MESFGRYELLRRVGAGGMADIFKARVQGPGGFQKSLAIKRILPNLVENREFLRMFAEEAKLVAALSHPNIVQVLDFGFQGEPGARKRDYFIAMEYVPGVNLATLLNRAHENPPTAAIGKKSRGPWRMPPELALYVAVEAARGLGYAHRRTSPLGKTLGIIHRDVSPQNILLAFSGEVKLTDFGIARVVSAISTTESGHVRGKVAYMSPEQAAADPSCPVDARSDLFSLGIVLFEMLTGTRLFPGGASLENHARVIGFRGLAEEHVARVTPALREIVVKALAADPAKRFQSAEDLERELTRALGPDVLVGGRQFLASLLARLFPEELRLEREEELGPIPPTNPQISLAEVDALGFVATTALAAGEPEPSRTQPSPEGEPSRPSRTVISPERTHGSDAPAEPTKTSPPGEEPSRGSVTIESDHEPTVPSPAGPREPAATVLRGHDRPLLPVVTSPRRTREATGVFDEPLFPARRPAPRWHAVALVSAGALLGVPAAMLVVSIAIGGRAPESAPTPRPTSLLLTVETPAAIPDATPDATPNAAISHAPPDPTAAPVATSAAVTAPAPRPPMPPPSAPARGAPAPRPKPSAMPSAEPLLAPLPSPVAVAAKGTLRVTATSPCQVFLDRSKESLTTPVDRVVAAGRHTIGFVHGASGLWLEQTWEVPDGGALELHVDVDQAQVLRK